MGYCSEVAITCEPKAYKMFCELFSNEEFNSIPDKVKVNADIHLLCWSLVKWYDEFEDMQAIYNVMDKLDNLNPEEGYGYSYLRVGEADGDEEERNNDHNNWNMDLYLRRTIDTACDFNTEEAPEWLLG